MILRSRRQESLRFSWFIFMGFDPGRDARMLYGIECDFYFIIFPLEVWSEGGGGERASAKF